MSQPDDVLAAERELLLAPVTAEKPTGAALRYAETYDTIAELRREDDASLPQGEWVRSLKQADWQACASLCVSTLTTRTKDLQIAAWLSESLFMLHGTPGARAGMRLIRELAERYWKELHPGALDDDEARIVALEWLDEKLSQRLKTLKISDPLGDAPPYRYHEWEQASYLENLGRKVGATGVVSADAITTAKIAASWQQTPPGFFAREVAEIDALLGEAEALAATLDGLAGRDAPSFRRTREIAAQLKEVLVRSGRMPVEVAEVEPLATAVAAEEASAEGEPRERAEPLESVPAGAIANRADAYRRLQQVADYLLRTEPHSPSGYLVQRAVRWGNASLATVLKELSQDQGNLRNMLSLLGIEGEEAAPEER